MVWVSLIHNGIAIAPIYKYINHVTVEYKNKKIPINETLATAFYLYKKINLNDSVFHKNFFDSIKPYLPTSCKNILSVSDFCIKITPVNKKIVNNNKFKYCFLNGKKENIDRYCAESESIFFGRGKHKLRGTYKPSVKQSDITLNLSKGHKPIGNWKSIICNKNVDWIACWNDPIQNKIKYVYPSSCSKLKSDSTLEKFDFARKVKKKLNHIRTQYISDFKSNNEKVLQHAIACYLIDSQCIRCGTDDENNTFGCTTLQKKHLTINHNKVNLYFFGKDSILFDKTFICKYPDVINYLKENLRKKTIDENIFHLISSTSLNLYLNNFFNNLTAKVFRTCHASTMYDKLLYQSHSIEDFKKAVSKVASLCNHTNLQTSKANYLDPRVTFTFANRNKINIDKLYSKHLIDKFKWARSVKIDFRF